ncbi:MAG: helix-turn-helix domain-containing protein [Flavobacteriaceae bacterium]|jgi:AraC-like DNA-binding protein|nr:helix-turn-helix domain-containing protein [Flavobacteriaceae bacterium]
MPKQKVIKVQQFDQNIPIEFYTIEDNLDLFDFDYHYQYNFYQIYWFTETSDSTQQIDFDNYALANHQIWIIYPGQVQYFNPTGIKGYYLAIDKDYFNRIINQEITENKLHIAPPLWFELTTDKISLFEALMHLFKQEWNTSKRTSMLEKYLGIYLHHIQDLKELSTYRQPSDNRVQFLLQQVELNYTSHQTNNFYANKIALSVKRMNELLVEATQRTISQHIHNRLLLEAKRLIGYSDLTIQQISSELGFSEVNYFNRFFKKHTALTPLSFRKKVKKVQ